MDLHPPVPYYRPTCRLGSKKPLASTNDTVLSPEMLLEPKEESTKPKKPRIVTTYWEDEKTICYQVEVHGVLVSRRQDTDYINGTKLLNVAGMSRGKRDGMLKSERNKYVVRVGAMKLKGVWIPFNRAAEIARNEGIDELLYPLFVKDIKAFYEERGSELKTWDPLELPPEVEKFDTKTQAI
ncbi:HTH APSES-type domain-containing protein [[Candida] zeylanoides]